MDSDQRMKSRRVSSGELQGLDTWQCHRSKHFVNYVGILFAHGLEVVGVLLSVLFSQRMTMGNV